jgi:hypothetical protein
MQVLAIGAYLSPDKAAKYRYRQGHYGEPATSHHVARMGQGARKEA